MYSEMEAPITGILNNPLTTDQQDLHIANLKAEAFDLHQRALDYSTLNDQFNSLKIKQLNLKQHQREQEHRHQSGIKSSSTDHHQLLQELQSQQSLHQQLTIENQQLNSDYIGVVKMGKQRMKKE